MEKKIVFLDLETTGVKVTTDRVIQIATFKTDPEFKERDPIRKYLFNPGIPIPAEATAIHGIKDEDVKDKPKFSQVAKSFLEYLTGCDVAGFNIIDFDLPLLSEELARAGLNWDTTGMRVFDSQRIFKYKEPRDLASAMVFYVGEVHQEAHDAAADILATAAVFSSQLDKYQDLKEMGPDKLAEFCAGGRRVDIAGKIVLNEEGKAVYSFGKSKGKEVAKDPGFANWILKTDDFTTNTKNVVKDLLHQGMVKK